MENLKLMSVFALAEYLGGKGVSEGSLEELKANKVSGQALQFLNEEELKELFPTIGDRALVRNVLLEFKKVSNIPDVLNY